MVIFGSKNVQFPIFPNQMLFLKKIKGEKDTKAQPQVEKLDEPNFSHTAAQNILLPGIFLFFDSLQPHFGSKSGLEGLRPGSGLWIVSSQHN